MLAYRRLTSFNPLASIFSVAPCLLQFLQMTNTRSGKRGTFSFDEARFSVNFTGMGLASYLRKASRGVSVTKDQPRAGSDEGGAMPKRLLPVIALSMALISPVVVQG